MARVAGQNGARACDTDLWVAGFRNGVRSLRSGRASTSACGAYSTWRQHGTSGQWPYSGFSLCNVTHLWSAFPMEVFEFSITQRLACIPTNASAAPFRNKSIFNLREGVL